ncbi:MAG: hypothetical protein EOM25_13790 [Deltaproteobacteria bacterium]|nr:hypothetical protein [Deltaproteobacteria bacterium]
MKLGDAQRKFVLECLQRSSCSIPEFRALGVLHSAARVMELRRVGHRIITEMEWSVAEDGKRHRVGRYIYLGKEQ